MVHFCEDDGPVTGNVVDEYQHHEGKMMIMRIFVLYTMIYWRNIRWYDDVQEVDNDVVNYVQGIDKGVFSVCGDTQMVFVGVMMLGI